MSRKPEANEKPEDAARIAAEAANHFARSLNRKPSKAERKAVEDWLAIDPRHAQAYGNLERIWRGSSQLPELKSRKRKSPRNITRRDIAKGAILLAAGAGVWRYASDHPFADYRTGAGERRSVELPDGSRVELAAWTRLSVAIDSVHRRIVLHEGEAFFHVAQDRRPFTVEAGRGVTTALGTAFGVEYRDGAARVLVTEHAVNVKLDTQSAMISAGSQILYGEGHLGVPETANTEAALAWREGWLIFTARPLGEVVESLNNWRGGRLVVVGAALAQRPITLIVDLARLDDIPMQLEKALPVRVIQITSILIFIVPS